MAAIVILEIQVKPEKTEEMRRMLKNNTPQALAFDGCLSVEFVENMDKPNNLVFIEKWKSREHYQKYFDWRASTGVLEAFSAMVEGGPSFRFFSSYEM